jgi:hypothetical protein
MSQRKYNKTKIESTQHTKRITLLIDLAGYKELLHDKQTFRHCLNEMIPNYPELQGLQWRKSSRDKTPQRWLIMGKHLVNGRIPQA